MSSRASLDHFELLGAVGLAALGGDVLPEEVPGGQSLIAAREPVLLVPLLVSLLAPAAAVLPLALGMFEAELPGPQPMLWPMVSEALGAVGLDVVSLPAPLVPPVVVCAMAPAPNVKAMTDVAAIRRRFIGVSSACEIACP